MSVRPYESLQDLIIQFKENQNKIEKLIEHQITWYPEELSSEMGQIPGALIAQRKLHGGGP